MTLATLITHSVIFKCIGVTKDNHSQEVLAMAAEKGAKGFLCYCL